VFAIGLDAVWKFFSPTQLTVSSPIAPHAGWFFTSLAVFASTLFLGLLWRAFTSSASALACEVGRHLREARQQLSDTEPTKDYDPEHRACFELVAAEAIRSSASPLLAALGLATAAAVVARILFSNNSAESAGSALVAVVVGLGGISALLDTSAAAWHGHLVRNETLPRNRKSAVDETTDSANNCQNGAAVASDTVGDMFRHLTVPSIHAIMKVLVTATVVLAPLFQ